MGEESARESTDETPKEVPSSWEPLEELYQVETSGDLYTFYAWSKVVDPTIGGQSPAVDGSAEVS